MSNDTRIYPGYEVTTRVVYVGGRNRAPLIDDLAEAGVEINDLGRKLLSTDAFDAIGIAQTVATVELTVRDLGFPHGAKMPEIDLKSSALGLGPCPLQLGPYWRLQYLDQPDSSVEQAHQKHRVPTGAVTVVSEPLSTDDDFPKGFYLRRIESVLWLRGYCSDAEHVWSPEDRLLFATCNAEDGIIQR